MSSYTNPSGVNFDNGCCHGLPGDNLPWKIQHKPLLGFSPLTPQQSSTSDNPLSKYESPTSPTYSPLSSPTLTANDLSTYITASPTFEPETSPIQSTYFGNRCESPLTPTFIPSTPIPTSVMSAPSSVKDKQHAQSKKTSIEG